jgi:peptidyl-prolyl cis-trans isomerase D
LAEDDGSLSQALRDEEGQIPPPQQVNMTRAELRPQEGQRIPTPLVLLFSMAEGTAKRLEAPNNLGWYVVELSSITAAPIEDEDPLFEQARASLSETFADELAEQLTASVREELGVDRNETAIEAVRKQLTGEI